MADPLTVALVGGGLAGLGSLFGAKKSSDAIEDSSARSVAEQRRQFDIALGLARPGITAGNTARDQLLRLLGLPTSGQTQLANTPLPGALNRPRRFDGENFPFNPGTVGSTGGPTGATPATEATDPIDIIRNTPGFQFQTEQGTRALNANRSAGGSSGGALIKDFTRFNQGTASSFYQDYANRLANLAGTGQTASTSAGNQAIATGRGISSDLNFAGAARASGITGATNSIVQILNDLARGAGSGAFTFGNPTEGILTTGAPI